MRLAAFRVAIKDAGCWNLMFEPNLEMHTNVKLFTAVNGNLQDCSKHLCVAPAGDPNACT